MEKDNKTKTVGGKSTVKDHAHSLNDKVIDLLSKVLSKIHFLELRENTHQRIVTSIILIPFALYAIFYSKDFFILLTLAVAIMMAVEWIDMVKHKANQKKWRTIGFFYILIPLYSAIKIRLFDEDILFWMFAVIWATDIFAFFAGKILGGPKLAPKVSPNKTWSGLIGGLIASALIGFISSFMFPGGMAFFIIASVILALIEQGSDLLESKFKRICDVKDSGKIIPGHGGVLDRLDGLMLVAPTVLLLMTFFASKFGL